MSGYIWCIDSIISHSFLLFSFTNILIASSYVIENYSSKYILEV